MMFRVMWKLPRMKSIQGSYECHDYKTLMRILEKSEGVTPSNVECMYIHNILSTGETIEVLAVEKDSNVVKLDTSRIDKEVKPTKSEQSSTLDSVGEALNRIKNAPANKPKIKLAKSNKPVLAAGYYNVYEAPLLWET